MDIENYSGKRDQYKVSLTPEEAKAIIGCLGGDLRSRLIVWSRILRGDESIELGVNKDALIKATDLLRDVAEDKISSSNQTRERANRQAEEAKDIIRYAGQIAAFLDI